MPAGEAAHRYYVGNRIAARVNLDGEIGPVFVNEHAPGEPYTDTNGNGRRDPGEPYDDANGNGMWDVGNSGALRPGRHAQPLHALARGAGPLPGARRRRARAPTTRPPGVCCSTA